MRNLVSLLVISVLSCGCTTIPEISRYVPESKSHTEHIQNYEVGELRTAYVGEAIIEKGALTYTEISEGNFRALVTLSSGAFRISKGALYPAIFLDEKDGSIYVQGDTTRGGVHGAKIDASGRLLNSNMFYFNLGGWQDNTLTNIAEVGAQLFEPAPTSKRFSPESFKAELLYLGKEGSGIRVSYREYKDDIARPAFFQDLTYNLEESNVIRYRKFRIRVEKSSNEEIEYVVLEH